MKREEKSQEVRERIISVSRRLFLKQGYAATTIRQILKETDLTTGTLYHFFQDKEDILTQIASDYLADTDALIDSLLGNDPDPIVHYVLIITLQLLASEKERRVAEFILQGYHSWRVVQLISRYQSSRNRISFEKYSRVKTDDEWYLHQLAINGVIHNCIADRINGGTIPHEERLRTILTVAFTFFNVPTAKLETAIQRSREIIRKNGKIKLYGVSVVPVQ